MKGMKRKMAITLALVTASLIGTFRGTEAKQRFISRIRTRYEDMKKFIPKEQSEVVLDEFEFSAFHNS
jgi:hypothetical protein